jgi:hypothetical protein
VYGLDGGLTLYQLVKLFDVVDVVSGVAAISNCPAMFVKYAVGFECRFAFVSRVEAMSNCPAMLVK